MAAPVLNLANQLTLLRMGLAPLLVILVLSREKRSDGEARTLGGWRRELVGAELLELLDGRLSLAVSGRQLSIEPRPSAQPPEKDG